MKDEKVVNQINQETEQKPLIPLKHIRIRAAVNGAFARLRLDQQFENNAQAPVEAKYIFPMPDEASVSACVMKIGDRKIEAVIKEREEAQKEYNNAIEAGHHASLLRQERPNIFTMNVGGIEPGEKISVKVDYVQRIPWQTGGGRFSIPLVVAPRFISGKPIGKQGGGWSEDTDEVPDASLITPVVAKEGVPYDANISIMFSPGFDCQLNSPSHESLIPEQVIKKNQTIEIKTKDIRTDRDFILVYQSLSKIPEMAVHAGKFQDENFVLASIIPSGETKTTDSDIVALLDISGSMSGAKVAGLKVIMNKVIDKLIEQQSGHNLCLIAFETEPHLLNPLAPVNDSINTVINQMETTGGTHLGRGLTLAHQQFINTTRPKTVLLITDGQTESLNYTGQGVRIISIGIDTAINDTTIKNLANNSGGTYEFVYPGENYDAVAGRIIGYLSGPVLQDVKVETEGEVVGVSDVFKGRPATIAVKLAAGQICPIKIMGYNPKELQIWEINQAVKKKECDFAAQIWAREFIRENQKRDVQIATSLKYGVLCNHTAFVAVSIKEVPGQKPVTVEIPVNLPHTWNYDSVFGSSSGMAMLALRSSGTRHFAPDSGVRNLFDSIDGDYFPPINVRRVRMPKEVRRIMNGFTKSSMINLFNQNDLAEKSVLILIHLSSDRKRAEELYEELKKELTPERISSLEEDKKAMLCYFLARIETYGLKGIKIELPSPDTKAWGNLTLKEKGVAYTPIVPTGSEAEDYIAWKFGKAEKPSTGRWSIVP